MTMRKSVTEKREEEGMREERKERPWENGSWREAGWWCWVQGHSGFFGGKGHKTCTDLLKIARPYVACCSARGQKNAQNL